MDEQSSKLKRIQNCQFEMLKEVVRICDLHGIEYWLAYGTMLGAVRHNGPIPWDDDLDIYMTMKGYLQFKKHCKKELDPSLILQDSSTDPNFISMLFKIRKKGTHMPSKGNEGNPISKFSGVWIDIFPLMDAGKTKQLRHLQAKLFKMIQVIKMNYLLCKNNGHSSLWIRIKIGIKRIINFPMRVYEQVLWGGIWLLGRGETNEVWAVGVRFKPWQNYSENDYRHLGTLYPKELFKHRAKYRYNDSEFYGVKDFDTYLTLSYSADYMTPKKYGEHLSDYSYVIV